MSTRQDVRVPDLGDFDEVEIVEVQVAVGDHVLEEDPLITLETDKAAMELPSPATGTVAKLAVGTGMRVSKGDLILVLEIEADVSEVMNELGADEPPIEEPAVAVAPESVPGGTFLVVVPDIGDFAEAEVIEVQVQVGSELALDDPIITLETDKAAMDVPSPVAGRVTSVAAQVGQKVGAGAPILELELSAPPPQPEAVAASSVEEPSSRLPAEKQAMPSPPSALPTIDETGFVKAHASPSVRKFARELGVNLGQIKGTGQKGRALKEDVKAFVKAILTGQGGAAAGPALPALPQVDFEKFGEIEIRPLSRIQKISGPRLHASWVNLPHVTQNDEADITELEERRQKLKDTAAEQDVRLTPLAFIIKACVIALKEFPMFNTSLSTDGTGLVYKKYFHIGFAADTPNGLLVPVIRDADLKDVMSIAAELGSLSERARSRKLTADEMQGGTFTVSSLGGIGGTHFTPIINAPEVAILGVGRSSFKPVWQDGKFVPRLILPISLSYDHRVIDGATGVRFTTFLAGVLADVDRLLLGS